jgi:hypothetical protein
MHKKFIKSTWSYFLPYRAIVLLTVSSKRLPICLELFNYCARNCSELRWIDRIQLVDNTSWSGKIVLVLVIMWKVYGGDLIIKAPNTRNN